LRVINSFPQWIPAELNGEKVSVYKVLPVTFKLTDPSSPVENPKIIAIDNILMPVNFDLNILNPTEIDTGNVIRPTTSEIKNQLIKKYGIVAENGIIEIYSNRFKKLKYKVQNDSWDTIAKINPNDKNAIYSLEDVDIIPKFVGGNMNLINFISNNLKYPDECKVKGIQGSTFIQFVVDKTGKVKDAVLKNKINKLLEAEAIRVVNILPNWIPGEKHGEKVNVRLTVPVKFGIKGAIYPMENDSSTDINSPPDRQLIILDGTILPYGFDINWLNSSDIQSYKLLIPKNAAEEREFKLRYGPFSSRGVFVAFSKRFYSDNKYDSFGNRIYQVIEQMPVFPGGEIALMKFVAENLKYPEASKAKNIQGRVIVRFVVNSAGKIEKSELVRSLNSECDKEALRIVSLFPTWTPGKQNGVNVSVFYTLPIRFQF